MSIIASAGPVAPGRIEFHVAGEWTGVYLDGKLIRVGDSYLADEWLQSFVGVKPSWTKVFTRACGALRSES